MNDIFKGLDEFSKRLGLANSTTIYVCVGVIGIFVFFAHYFFSGALKELSNDWLKRRVQGALEDNQKVELSKPSKGLPTTNQHPPEDSPITLLGLNGPKSYREYREDMIQGIKWTWRWRERDEDEPSTDAISYLIGRCTVCGRELIEEPVADRLEGDCVVFRCDDTNHPSPWLPGTPDEAREKVKRTIDTLAHQPIEWQRAIERVRLAVPQQKIHDDPPP